MRGIKLSPFKRFLMLGLVFMTNAFFGTNFAYGVTIFSNVPYTNMAEAAAVSFCIDSGYADGTWGALLANNRISLMAAMYMPTITDGTLICFNTCEATIMDYAQGFTCADFDGFSDTPKIAASFLFLGSVIMGAELYVKPDPSCHCAVIEYRSVQITSYLTGWGAIGANDSCKYYTYMCTGCATGQIVSNNTCVSCSPGTYKGQGNDCHTCASGYYAEGWANTTCAKCPTGMISNTSVLHMRNGYGESWTSYISVFTNPGASKITECWVGSYCSENCTGEYDKMNSDVKGHYFPNTSCFYKS